MRVHQRQGTLKVKRGTCCCYGGFMARHRERQAGNGHVTQGTSPGTNKNGKKRIPLVSNGANSKANYDGQQQAAGNGRQDSAALHQTAANKMRC